MQMKAVRFLIFGVLLAGLSACGTMHNVTVSQMSNVQVSSLEGNKVNITLVANVNNPNKRKITIKKVDFDANMGRQHLGKLYLKNKVVIPREYNGDVTAAIVLELRNMLLGGSVLLSGNPQKLAEKVKVTGKIRVKAGLFGKSFLFKDQSITEVAKQLKGTE